MRLKEIQILFFPLFLFTVSVAQADSVRDNFYIGLSGMDSINHYKLSAKNPTTGVSTKEKKTSNDAMGSAFVGYGWTIDCYFYIAAELGTYFPRRSVDITRSGVTLTPFTFEHELTMQDYLTGDILLGFRPFDSFLFYLRGGATYANITLDQFNHEAANVPSFRASQDKAAGRVGAGINYALTRHFGLGLDYIFTIYQHLNVFWPQFNIRFIEKNSAHYIGISGIYSF